MVEIDLLDPATAFCETRWWWWPCWASLEGKRPSFQLHRMNVADVHKTASSR